jgi:hypothetical protein
VRSPAALFRRLLDTQLVGPGPAYAADTTAALAAHRPEVVLTSVFGFGVMAAAEAAGVPFRLMHPNIWPLPAAGVPRTLVELVTHRMAALPSREQQVLVTAAIVGGDPDRLLLADPDAWPRTWYARRGFVPVSRVHVFTRLTAEGPRI